MQQLVPGERAAFSPAAPRRPRATPAAVPTTARLERTLGTARARIADLDVRGGMELLCDELTSLRRTLSPLVRVRVRR